jgi:hypothetical protein
LNCLPPKKVKASTVIAPTEERSLKLTEFMPGQRVYVVYAVGRMSMAFPATFVRRGPLNGCKVKDDSGNVLQVRPEHVFASKEALEASVKNLRVSLDAATGEITEFPE